MWALASILVAAGIKDVAARAGVSIATVSNVMNRPNLVAEKTRLRVRSAIAELGFVPTGAARQLRAGTSHMVSLVVPDIGNPFFAQVARGVEHRAAELGLAVFVCSTEGNPDTEDRYIQVLLEQRPRGVLLTPSAETERPLERLAERIPVVLVDRESPDTDHCSVSIDDFGGGGTAVRHLYELGHRSLAWVVGPKTIPQCEQRTAGVEWAAGELGMEVAEILVPTMTLQSGGVAAEALLAGPLSSKNPPTAVVCANDLLALGLEFKLLAAGISVPGQISIVGFDDIEFAAWASVPLTSLARPAFSLGTNAVDMLTSGLGPDHRHEQIQFKPRLQARDSTGPVDPSLAAAD